MKRFFLFFFAVFFVAATAHADSQKMDLLLQSLSNQNSPSKPMLSKSLAMTVEPRWNLLGKSFGSVQLVQVLIKTTNPQLTKSTIETAGGKVSTVAGRILVAKVPVSYLETLSEQEEVIFVEASKKLTRKMDTARAATNVDDVQAGLGGGIAALTGQDVIVGFVDDGFDYGNEDFSGRVQYVKQQGTSSFELCAKAQVDDSECDISDGGQGTLHGTHVVGIAAGADGTYTGVAPDADIFFIINSMDGSALPDSSAATDSVDTFSGAVIDGVADIFAGADQVDKAAVVNLSLGTSLGAHDDTSLLEVALNSLLEDANGDQLPGRAIVNAAGNENKNTELGLDTIGGIHAAIDVGGAADPSAWRFIVLDSDISAFGGAMADIWFRAGDNCTVEARAYYGAAVADTGDTQFIVGPMNITESNAEGETANDGSALLQLQTDSSDPNNDRPHEVLTLTKHMNASWSSIVSDGSDGYIFDIVVRAASGNCKGDMWLYPDQTSIVGFFNDSIDGNLMTGDNQYALKGGDSNKTTTIPGTASSLITVGSYMQPKPAGSATSIWEDEGGDDHDQTDAAEDTGTGGATGEVSLFSSLGPTGEISGARTKPDVVAPGEPIISTQARGASISNSDRVVDENHFKLEGTSMAAPHVAGIIALMFERNNTLTATEVKNFLKDTATPLDGVGENTQGAGLVNATEAIRAITADTSAYAGTRDVTTDDFGEDGFSTFDGAGAGGSGHTGSGCSLVLPLKR